MMPCEKGACENMPPSLHEVEQQQLYFQVAGLVLLIIRLIEMLSYHPLIGEVMVTLVEMVIASWPVRLRHEHITEM